MRLPVADRALHPIRRTHLEEMTGPLGIWQHARGRRPNEAFGYCTDDVARFLTLDLMHSLEIGWGPVRLSAWRSLRFLDAAFVESTGRFQNFRAADGRWLETGWSEDGHGRALRALGLAMTRSPEPAFAADTRSLFLRGLAATGEMRSVRGQAAALLGCAAALQSDASPEIGTAFCGLAGELKRAFTLCSTDGGWPWPDETLTYENGLLPEALLRAGAGLGDTGLVQLGLSTLDWLEQIQSASTGFQPIGNRGWWRRGATRAVFDQQPIEAASMVLAAAAAFEQTGDARHRTTVERAYGWFLGDNCLGLAVADPLTGGCHDGLTQTGVNLNQGAESTLMWQMALEAVRATRRLASGSRAGSMPASTSATTGGRR